jgi:hypothetical protein
MKSILNPDRDFVSDIDKFLTAFDKQHPKKSASQAKEIKQYQTLMTKRDIKN